MSITIEGKEYEFVGVSELGVMSFKPIQQPTFSVGMRVMSIGLDWNSPGLCFTENILYFTRDMIYRIFRESANSFTIINDKGISVEVPKEIVKDLFTPYEKPKEGDMLWFIDVCNDCLQKDDFRNNEADNMAWNLGLAFKTKEQATFARERLSKLF